MNTKLLLYIYFIEIEKTEITELKKMLNEEKRKVQDLQCEIQKFTSMESYAIKSFKDVGSQFNYMTSMTGNNDIVKLNWI